MVGYLRNHCDLDNTRYERGHVEIPLLTIVENEQDEILIKAVKSSAVTRKSSRNANRAPKRSGMF